jgi:hypothetical protein
MKKSEYIQELQDVIRRIHGAESEHVESLLVKEAFQGKSVWEGVVEVFTLTGHPSWPPCDALMAAFSVRQVAPERLKVKRLGPERL